MFAFWRRMCYDVVNQMMKTELLLLGAVSEQTKMTHRRGTYVIW
jgi:hypothetical protein